MCATGFSTTLIHRVRARPRPPAPLTTPIYETTTFIFDNAEADPPLQRRRPQQVSLFPLREPDRRRRRGEARGGRRRRGGAGLQFGHGGDVHAAAGAAEIGRRGRLQRRRSTAARFTCSTISCRSSASRTRFVSLDELQPARNADRRAHAARLVRVADQPDAALRRRPSRRRSLPGARRPQRHRQHVRQPVNQRPLELGVDLSMQSATKYLERPQRRHRRRRVGLGCAGEGSRDGAPSLGGVLDPQPAYLLIRSLKTLAVRVQRHNLSAMAVATALEHTPAGETACSIPACRRIRITRWPSRQMTGFGGMVCLDLDRRRRGRLPRVRPAADHQAGGEPRRCRECVQPADPDVAVGALRRPTCRGGNQQRHDARVDRTRGSGRHHRRPATGARLR